jgi:hypothetical protein
MKGSLFCNHLKNCFSGVNITYPINKVAPINTSGKILLFSDSITVAPVVTLSPGACGGIATRAEGAIYLGVFITTRLGGTFGTCGIVIFGGENNGAEG